MTAEELAGKIAADPRATAVLLDALVALELLAKKGSRYEVPPDVAELLTGDSPVNVLAGVRHQGNCLRRWDQLARVVQTGQPARREPSIRGEAGDCESFISAMNSFSGPMVLQVVERLSPLRFQRLLDIGGASGTWTIAFLRAVPEATAVLFDLPQVMPLARDRLARAGLADRVSLVAGDFDTDDLPGGADIAWLSAIAHQNSRQQNRLLYRKIHAALVAGGTLVIRDIVMDVTKTTAAGRGPVRRQHARRHRRRRHLHLRRIRARPDLRLGLRTSTWSTRARPWTRWSERERLDSLSGHTPCGSPGVCVPIPGVVSRNSLHFNCL